jgi:hypothetical protein
MEWHIVNFQSTSGKDGYVKFARLAGESIVLRMLAPYYSPWYSIPIMRCFVSRCGVLSWLFAVHSGSVGKR